MIRYIPGFIGQQYINNIFRGKFAGFVLLFDIADFTPITTHFNKHGKQGAEELRAFLDFAFGEPIRIVEAYRGFVTLFAGDAFCAVFSDILDQEIISLPKELNSELTESDFCLNHTAIGDKDRTLNAVHKIRRYFMDKTAYRSALGEIKLKIRLNVSYGDINWQIFKNDLQNEYVFYGKPLKDLAALSSLKEDLVFSLDAAEHIGIKFFKKIKKDGYIYIKETRIKDPEHREREYLSSEHLTAIPGFINPKYQIESPQPEIRPAGCCFANLDKISFKDREAAISHIQRLADKYSGFVTRYDATDKGMVALILFGMPISEGKTLERLCRFALEIIAKVPLLAIGLAKGNVYAGYTGSTAIKEYTALGTAVNLAARLMGKAETGEVITDNFLYSDIKDKFAFEKKDTIQLKGIKKPIMSYRLKKRLFQRRAIRQTNFTGRIKLLTELKQSLNNALNENKNLSIYIYGNAGIGKSRLSYELIDCFSEKKFNRFFLYCDSVIQRSFEPVKQIIRQYFLTGPEQDQRAKIRDFRSRWKLLAENDDELIRIESIIASIIGYEWDKSIWSMLPPREKPKQKKNAFLTFMAKIAIKKPVIIHLDDGQWIDAESKDYFQALSGADIRPIQILFSCRYFDDGRKPDLGLKNHTKITKNLSSLDDESSREMIRHILKLHTVPQKTSREINSRAMGNPFFIEQLCNYLKEIEKIDSQGRLTEDLGPMASFRISDIIGSRIDRLTANVRECVYNASVLGMEFNVQVLSEMLKRPLDTDLTAGKSNMIWKDLNELQYLFSHIMIKDTAYLRIMYNKLKTLHHLAAEAMEIYFKESADEHLQEIANHYERADIPDKAAFYYAKAGAWSTDKYNFIKAEFCLKKALEINEKCFGSEHIDTADCMHDLANLYKEQGKYAKAEPLYKNSLQIREKALGKDHPDVATSLNDLAILNMHQGKYAEAEPLCLHALEIRKKALGKDHPRVAQSLHNMATLNYYQGKYAEAEPLYLHALKIRKKALEKDHPDVATSLNNLAGLYADQCKYAEAEPLYLNALQIRKKALGKDHPLLAVSIENLAILHVEQGSYAEAEPLFLQSLQIREKALGKDHPRVADSLSNLAILHVEQGNYAEAEPLYNRALKICEKALGTYHANLARFLNGLAILYWRVGKYTEAEILYKRSLKIREKALGKDHPDVAQSLNNLAGLYLHQSKYAEAGPLYERALRIKENTFGNDHIKVADALNNLAMLYFAQEKYAEAEPLLKRAVQIVESALENDNASTEKYRKDLKDCQIKMKKADKKH